MMKDFLFILCTFRHFLLLLLLLLLLDFGCYNSYRLVIDSFLCKSEGAVYYRLYSQE